MLLLAFDTATPAITAALYGTAPTQPGPPELLAESTQVDARRHGELLLPSVDGLLRRTALTPADLTALVVGVGPGPYTGLRVGLTTAVTMGEALGIPVYGLCTLDAIAYAARAAGLTGPFAVATDARRKEVYWARYGADGARQGSPAVDRPERIADSLADVPVVGAGAVLHHAAFRTVLTAADGMPELASAAAHAALAAEEIAAGRTASAEPVGETRPADENEPVLEAPDENKPADDAGARRRQPVLVPPVPLYLRRPDAQVPAGYKAVLPPVSV
ncbi:tRNA (adenosine(37)-N6)-threonylcarbamoyltransferase complex dimerization subunit type 1 TsaB [Allostreptomyces psammosilenae]|uniref:tRNA threonylcarbamoyl adenosine modification protein YeaZ n=1 Tax=Allostreptomyces psammosilenae TaxID=1892865 RepID=A0A853A651_9ACTN|nr:tRNA (adenosine(37)-N6)-threonylcarbamoyltransferase complex dimerization subunit type 1 TsaB [Allostreptomyces psammosilenae]NYI05952.1 tRNA threonylcarbamoyl adenosine modification protein YeaZ [Allostreptomyces psammosilenae]